jgi:tetratricopeptide (TPR) repeat protein
MKSAAISQLGLCHLLGGDFPHADSLFEEARKLDQSCRFIEDDISYNVFMGLSAFFQNDLDAALVYLDHGLELGRTYDYRLPQSFVLEVMGAVALARGDGERARSLLEQARDENRAIGRRGLEVRCLLHLARVLTETGLFEEARFCLQEALPTLSQVGMRMQIPFGLEAWASLAVSENQESRAARLYGAADSLRLSLGIPRPPVWQGEYTDNIHRLRERLGESEFTAAWAEGKSMSLEQAVAYAMEH